MSKKKKKKDTQYIKSFVVKEQLDIKLFHTNVVVHDCSAPGKYAVVLCVAITLGEMKSIEYAIENLGGESNKINGIPIISLYSGDPKIDQYLSGDIPNDISA